MAHKTGVRPEERTDADLLAMSRATPDLFGVIYARHAGAVHRFLARRVGAVAADDLLGEVFVVAVGARLRVKQHPSGSALPWLYGIASNVIRSHRRQAVAAVEPGERLSFDWDAIDARLDAVGRREELRAVLDALTDAERELLLLVAWEELSPTEAAEVLGLTAVAARSRLHRARTRAQAVLSALAAAQS